MSTSGDATVIDFKASHDRKHGPDPAHVFVDARGVKWFEFTCSYRDAGGEEFSFSIWAADDADAERRLQQLRQSAKVDGQIHATMRG